jgi:hypothetical protein
LWLKDMPYTKKDASGRIIGGRYENFQEGIAESFVSEADWQLHLDSQTKVDPFAPKPTQKLWTEVQTPNFPWATFYGAAQKSVEFNAMLTLLLQGLSSGFSEEFVASRFREMWNYLQSHPTFPQITTAQQEIISQAVVKSGMNPEDFFGV